MPTSVDPTRAELAKSFLVEQGVPEKIIETQAFGEERNLSPEEVTKLLEENPDLSQEAQNKALQRMLTMVYAHNRRVDISLSMTGQQLVRGYPFAAEDFAVLVKRGPAIKGGVELAADKKKLQN